MDISRYSVKFEECTFIKTYDPALAETKGSPTVLKTAHFVIFRLCPAHDCYRCNYNYGEYMIDLESYLQSTVEYFQDYQEEMCDTCEENCYNQANNYNQANDYNQANEDENADEEQEGEEEDGEEEDGGRKLQYDVDCDTCWDECQKIENMEENGYIDATEFLECAMVYDPEDDNKEALYAGPICASSGTKIKIGIFKDEDCMYLDASKDVDDYLIDGDGVAMKLSHALLKSTYTDTCISCMEPQDADDNDGGDDAEDDDKVIEMCEALYDESAKCEKTHGFDNGYANYYGYENQLAQEGVVCDFIGSLKSGTYDEEGEIILVETKNYVRYQEIVTGGQQFALAFSILATLIVAMYAAVLRRKLARLISYDAVNTLEMKDVSANKYMSLDDELPPSPDDD